MSDHYEIIGAYAPLVRPLYPAQKSEKELMLKALRVFGCANKEALLATIGQILGRPFPSIEKMRSSDARKVIDACNRAKRQRRQPSR